MRTVVDRPIAVVNAVNTTPVIWQVHVDHLNRPIRMTDATKASVWDVVWAPWGNVYSISGTATLDARFPGQWYQLESGLHYNWHRHYDPTLGRYTQPDPLGFVDGPSVYGYVRGRPGVIVDPRGLWGFGVDVDATIAGLPGGSVGVAWGYDSEIGQFEYYYAGGAVGAGAGVAAMLMGYVGTVCDLAGEGFGANISAGTFAGGWFFGKGSKTGGLMAGVGAGAPFGVDLTYTYTWLDPKTAEKCRCRSKK